MRVAQPAGERGSLKWLQHAVNHRPESVLHPAIGPVDWLSPLASDEFAEYRDGAFLARLGLAGLSAALAEFWPASGPQWDALGRANDAVVLVEAKAHLDEFMSPGTKAGAASRARIEQAFATTRAALKTRPGVDWTEVFYQYANRLAHLYFLRQNRVDACLLFVDFINDADMAGPASAAEWEAAYRVADYALGLPKRHALSGFIHHIHPDVRMLDG